MFPFSRCLGRKRKADPQESEKQDQTMSNVPTAVTPATSSGDSGSTKVACEIEPKMLHTFEGAMGTPVSLKSAGKKSYCSSIISRSSASLSQFCQSSSSVEPPQTISDCRFSVDFGWPAPPLKTKMLSGALNLQIKCADFNFDRRLTVHEESEEPVSARPLSYSDDPFAPPTPRIVTHTSSYYRDSSAESDATRGSAIISQAHEIDINHTYEDGANSPPLPEPQLPTIARISKLSFDWILELPNTPTTPQPRSRLASSTKASPLTSPLTTYRTPMGTNAMNTPRTPNSQTFSSSRSRAANQVPFPEYP